MAEETLDMEQEVPGAPSFLKVASGTEASPFPLPEGKMESSNSSTSPGRQPSLPLALSNL